MEVEVYIKMYVDPDAEFLSSDDYKLVSIRDTLEDAIYEIDDIKIEEIDVNEL